MTAQEAGRYTLALLPKTWDPPAVRALKKQMSLSLIEAMEEAGGTPEAGTRWLEQNGNVEQAMQWELEMDNPPGAPAGGPANAAPWRTDGPG